ncbi:hypothetical protein C7Y66_04825 [Chroococcidiopsis sp. CCALA 051]|nr:hypothetical protein C7Y66_04825 [Chroococcidiopsis sp. CCALA 051]
MQEVFCMCLLIAKDTFIYILFALYSEITTISKNIGATKASFVKITELFRTFLYRQVFAVKRP